MKYAGFLLDCGFVLFCFVGVCLTFCVVGFVIGCLVLICCLVGCLGLVDVGWYWCNLLLLINCFNALFLVCGFWFGFGLLFCWLT